MIPHEVNKKVNFAKKKWTYYLYPYPFTYIFVKSSEESSIGLSCIYHKRCKTIKIIAITIKNKIT
jgi:hypothetical protein